jgi:hypothetical protein
MMDTLETAAACGLSVKPEAGKGAGLAAIDFDPHRADLDRIIEAWLPLTFAVNSINRSMGLPDLYPFVLAPAAIVKLAFVHRLIGTRSEPHARSGDEHNRALPDAIGGTLAQPKRP